MGQMWRSEDNLHLPSGTRTGVNGLVSKSLSLLSHPTSPCYYFPDRVIQRRLASNRMYNTKDSLELLMFLPPPPCGCWDYRYALPTTGETMLTISSVSLVSSRSKV